LLDEPTNDLDIDTLQQLEDLLDSWAGTLVVISHDRYLVERVCEKVVALFGDGGLTDLPGGIDEYLQRRDSLRDRESTTTAPAADKAPSNAADQRAARKELARLERRLEVLHKKEAELHAALAEAATDSARLLKLDAELRAVLAEESDVEAAWMAAAEAVEG
ncbi:MAG TPA: ABC transporter ATP-binding protein, partial [Lentzea sp.]|nr:ABC transporter ATP-binding protein [Lentzea sp.]